MPSAQPTYQYAAYAPATQAPARRPRISVVPGTGKSAEEKSKSNITFVTVAVLVIIAMALLAAVSIGRVALASAATTVMVDSDNISSNIEEARSYGTELEVQQATLSSPAALKAKAAQMGMIVATDIDTITLDEDVVVYDEAGNLSLSKSVQVATRI